MDSVSAPISSVMSTREIWLIVTGTFVRTASLKPGSEILTSYGPARTFVSV